MSQRDYKRETINNLLTVLDEFADELPGFDLVLDENFNVDQNLLPQLSILELDKIVQYFENVIT